MTTNRINLFPKKLLIGVSGGADSVFLLHWLLERGEQEQLIVCHLHHGIRGEEADRDADFVRSLAQQHGLHYEERRVCVEEIMAASGGSLETVAREERLRFFGDIAERYGIYDVALAHHADDQAETILMQLCRGTKALPGMQSPQEIGPLTIWRPLLGWRKSEILDALRDRAQDWREDLSNYEADVTRNRMRLEVVPLLSEIFRRDVVPLVNRVSEREEGALLTEAIAGLALEDPQGRLFLPKVETLSSGMQREVIYRYLKCAGVEDLTSAKVEECVSLIDDQSRWKVNLPGGLAWRRKEKRLFIER